MPITAATQAATSNEVTPRPVWVTSRVSAAIAPTTSSSTTPANATISRPRCLVSARFWGAAATARLVLRITAGQYDAAAATRIARSSRHVAGAGRIGLDSGSLVQPTWSAP